MKRRVRIAMLITTVLALHAAELWAVIRVQWHQEELYTFDQCEELADRAVDDMCGNLVPRFWP